MAGGVSKYYARAWVQEPDGTRFEDRVGRILSQGHDLKATFREQALNSAKKEIAFENETAERRPTRASYTGTPSENHYLAQSQTSGSQEPEVDKRGMVWVSRDGAVIGRASREGFSTLPPPPTPIETLRTAEQKALASLRPGARSAALWRTVNPACMEVLTKMPVSSQTDHFRHRGQLGDKVDKTHFRQKTDFSAYAAACNTAGAGQKR